MNTKRLLVIFAITFFCFQASAQDWSGRTYKYFDIYPGYIITLKGDTVTGYVEHNSRMGNQQRCIYYTDASKKGRKEYKASELKGYGVGDKDYRSIHYSGGLMAKPQSFVLVGKPGHITQFYYYSRKEGTQAAMKGKTESDADFDARITTDEIVWQKGDEDPIQHASLALGFAKKMSKLVSEHTELASKVADKEKGYGLGHIFNIIDEYNKWWESRGK